MTAAVAQPRAGAQEVPQLEVDRVSVSFAGVKALSDVSFTVAPGTVHALIGPNGAGKSTCFNVISGVYRAHSGTVRFGSEQIDGQRPHRIAALGIGRAFQNIALSAHATVAENLMLGRHHLSRAGFVSSGLRLPSARREHARHLERVREIAEFLGLGRSFDTPAGLLSYGDQKRVEVGRGLAMEPRLLLLDEPAAGMNAEETQVMAEGIVSAREALDISVLLVEHDMGLVMGISDRVTVLDFGRCIADGTPSEVQSDPEVVRAYLGAGDDNADEEPTA